MIRGLPLACAIFTLSLAVLDGEQGSPSPKPLVPAAATSIAADPEPFYGQIVSVTAAVDRVLSPTAFIVAQRPKQDAAGGLLVQVEVLSAPLTVDAYVTVIGEVVRHDGRPAIRAASVITRDMVDLAKRLPPPMSPGEAAFDAVMKRIGPAFNSVRAAVGAAAAAEAAAPLGTLADGFAETETFWKARGPADARRWAAEARAHTASLQRAVAAGRWDDAKAAMGSLQQTCAACHGAYRERQDDGSYRLRVEK